ncbi:MAG: helix-turn-helix domain-containing protein [Acidimicrobiales bacterium]
MTEPIKWMGTPEACARLGVTLRTLYRFIDEGQLPAYKMGRVIRLQAHEVDAFIERARIRPGTLEHLYPDPRPAQGARPENAGQSLDQLEPDRPLVDFDQAGPGAGAVGEQAGTGPLGQ